MEVIPDDEIPEPTKKPRRTRTMTPELQAKLALARQKALEVKKKMQSHEGRVEVTAEKIKRAKAKKQQEDAIVNDALAKIKREEEEAKASIKAESVTEEVAKLEISEKTPAPEPEAEAEAEAEPKPKAKPKGKTGLVKGFSKPAPEPEESEEDEPPPPPKPKKKTRVKRVVEMSESSSDEEVVYVKKRIPRERRTRQPVYEEPPAPRQPPTGQFTHFSRLIPPSMMHRYR